MLKTLLHTYKEDGVALADGLRTVQSQPTWPLATSKSSELATPQPSHIRRFLHVSGNADPRPSRCG